jgi:DNA-binding CsgD family transcriptional regulator
MNVFDTQIHLVTLVFIVLELMLLAYQLPHFLQRPQDRQRLWYLVLLFLLFQYNVTSELFPNPNSPIRLNLQYMMRFGSGFLTAAYFPYYFYKAYHLKSLRFHALYGAPLFLLLPYLVFFVIIYSINNNLDFSIMYGFIVPFIYGNVLLFAIPAAIRTAYNQNRNREDYIKQIAVYGSLAPWVSLGIMDYFHASQLLEVFFANLGIIVISLLLLWKSIRQMRMEYRRNLYNDSISPEVFLASCLHYGLTKAEIQIVQMIGTGMSNKEIADKIFISEETVKKHIHNIFRKTGVKNRTALIHKLQSSHYF